ncbi:hypothetical protein [Streptomyces sp. NPDC088752]|uniref:hypothetical protein n=1 Tax=Streptomyces sp. NPDC088752 TaxID=3154963 RepID=UPI0034258378
MDPVDLEHLLYELSSEIAVTVSVPAEHLIPGCVLAGPSGWDHHVVTVRPMILGAENTSVTIRHLNGGHDHVLRLKRRDKVTIYRQRLDASQFDLVPSIPRCRVPVSPQRGDRVAYHAYAGQRLGEGIFFEFNGAEWQRVLTVMERGRVRTVIRPFPHGLADVIGSPENPDPGGWYSYLPVTHRPMLYVDGVPMPARGAVDLVPGDVIRIPGGGRLQVDEVRTTSTSTKITVRLVNRSLHPMRHFMWARTEGATAEHYDSGRTHTLYPTEYRADELLTASHLRPGDTAIIARGLPAATVVTVEELQEGGLFNRAYLHVTAADGRPLRVSTEGEPRYYLLHRPQRSTDHGYAPAVHAARAHA